MLRLSAVAGDQTVRRMLVRQLVSEWIGNTHSGENSFGTMFCVIKASQEFLSLYFCHWEQLGLT